jgi:hypothetical protein
MAVKRSWVPEEQPMATFPMAQWQPTSHEFPGEQPWRRFSWLKRPTLSRAPGTAHGDISHGPKGGPGFSHDSMAPTLMGAKATLC